MTDCCCVSHRRTFCSPLNGPEHRRMHEACFNCRLFLTHVHLMACAYVLTTLFASFSQFFSSHRSLSAMVTVISTSNTFLHIDTFFFGFVRPNALCRQSFSSSSSFETVYFYCFQELCSQASRYMFVPTRIKFQLIGFSGIFPSEYPFVAPF